MTWRWTLLGLAAVSVLVVGCGTSGGDTPPSVLNESAASQAHTVWAGVSPVSSSISRALAQAMVETPDGELVPLPKTRPLLVFAPWCEHCHRLIDWLEAEGLLSRFTLIAAGLSMYGTQVSINAADEIVRTSFVSMRMPVPDHVLFAMPGGALDRAVTQYPTVFVRHDDRWYAVEGDVERLAFWQQVLNSRG